MAGWQPLVDRALAAFNARQGRLTIRRTGARARAQPRRPRTPSPSIAGELFAQLYITGEGLEIGALDSPLPLPPGARVRYVDRLGTDELRTHYQGLDIIDVDIVEDGEQAAEHPARLLGLHRRQPLPGTLRGSDPRARDPDVPHPRGRRPVPGGPRRRASPSTPVVPSTPLAHLRDDHLHGAERFENTGAPEDGCASSRTWMREGRASALHQLLEMDYSIHYHVWRLDDLLAFFAHVVDFTQRAAATECAARFGLETICVLCRTGGAGGAL